MAGKRTAGSRSGLIHCDNCGEYYSASYRRCPFCDEYEDDYEYEDGSAERSASRGGGKRLAPSNRRGGGYRKTSPLKIIGWIVSLAVIIAAIWILATVVRPLVRRGDVDPVDPDSSQTAAPGTSPNAIDPAATATPPADVTPTPDTTPTADITPASNDGGATGFSLNKSEFTISDEYPDPVTLKVTFTPTGATGTITWSSSDPDVASVDQNGKVSPGSKKGSATITAALSNGVTQTCKVVNRGSGSTTTNTPTTNAGTSSETYTINNSDFTFYKAGEQFKLKVNGYTGNVTWTSSNTSIATVSSDGTVTGAGSGKGSCTVTGTLDNGATVKAIVRIDIS